MANTLAKAFVEYFVCYHGITDPIKKNQGPDFMSKMFKKCLENYYDSIERLY